MRPAIVDRLSVIVIAAALVLWCGCLVILWALAFDASGVSAPSALGGLLLGVWVSAGWPGRVARGAQRLLGWLGMQDVPAMELATARASGARRVEARAMTRLLAAAAIFAAVCGTLSTLAIYASKSLADILPARFAATHVAWRGLELVAYFVGMLPMALGMVVAFLVSAILRGGSGRDVYASVVREWLLAAALGLVALAAAWWWGANLLGLARVMAVLLLAVAGMLFQRQEVTIRPRLGGSAIEPGPQRRKRLGIAVTFALLVLVLAVQGRVLCDVFAVDAGGVACWAGVSLLLLTMAMRKVDRRSGPPGRAQEIGATIGVSACLMLQLALGVACLYLGPGWMLVGVLAAAAQVPLARLGAVLLSRQRRLFATGGGRARAYLSSAAGGAAVGLCGYVLAMSLAGGGMVLLGVGLVVLTWSAVRGIGVAKRPVRQVQWAACAAALMCAVTAATIVCVRRVREEIGPVRPGAWLSGLPLRRVADGWARAGGYLPLPSPRPSEAVTRALAEALLDGRYGSRWWSLVGSAADMPADWPRQGMTVVSSPDGDVGLRAAGGPVVLGVEGAGLRAVGSGDPFEATFLAPLPADHPQAWRCYNETVMSRHSRRAPGGVMVLRTQAQAGNARAVLAVAKTFQTVMGSGWAAFHIDERTIDVLLIGPEDAARRPVGVEGLTVVSLAALFDGATWRVRPIRVSAPSAGWGRWAGAIDLRARLRQVARAH